MERYTMRIDGKVQGVWFRQSTANKAKELSLNGYVENEPGGSVYVEAEGSREALMQLVSWCLTGPDQADVKGITVVKVPVAGYTTFEIKY
jgi:acylphosphatase